MRNSKGVRKDRLILKDNAEDCWNQLKVVVLFPLDK